jgi:hypothetical protein
VILTFIPDDLGINLNLEHILHFQLSTAPRAFKWSSPSFSGSLTIIAPFDQSILKDTSIDVIVFEDSVNGISSRSQIVVLEELCPGWKDGISKIVKVFVRCFKGYYMLVYVWMDYLKIACQ